MSLADKIILQQGDLTEMDVDAIVKNVLEGNGRKLEGPLTPQMFGYDASVKGYGPDPARARKLLAEAGYPDGLEITLESSAGRNPTRGSIRLEASSSSEQKDWVNAPTRSLQPSLRMA